MSATIQSHEEIQATTSMGSETSYNDLYRREHLSAPDQAITDKIWIIVITAFAVVLVGSFLTLAAGIILQIASSNLQVILTVFTTVTGFLAGLFTTSPFQATAKKE